MKNPGTEHIRRLATVLGEQLRDRRAFLAHLAKGMIGLGAALSSRPLPGHAQGVVRRGGELRVAWLDSVDTLDPHFTASLGAIKIQENIYNGLLKVEFDGRRVSFVPDLVEKWLMPDPVTHILTLRRGVRFHDGEECTAEVVRWNQERVRDPSVKSPHAWKLAYLDRIEILDRYQLKITFAKPYQFLFVAWTGSTGRAGTIVSPKAVAKYGADYGRHPVGTGPFRLVEWIAEDRVVLERNPHYFEMGTDGKPLPYLDRITIRFVRDGEAALSRLVSGDLHAMDLVPFELLPQLRRHPEIQLNGGVEGNYTYVGMNNRRPPFDDPALRRAVAYAIDRTPLLSEAYYGGAIQACSAISPPMSFFYNPDQCSSKRGQHFDLARARQFRAQSRHQGTIDVEWMVVEKMTGSGGVGPRIAKLVAPMLEKIGIRAHVQSYDDARWRRKRDIGDFQMYDEGWVADLDPDETLYPEWATGRPWNFVRYSNPEFDRLVSAAQFEANLSQRKVLYDKADLLLAHDAPCAFIAHFKVFKAFGPTVKGFHYLPVDSMRFHTVQLVP